MLKKSTIFIIILLTAFIQLMYFVMEQKEISNAENRTLAVFKPFNFKNYFNGTFQNQLEDALKDQIFGRQLMIQTVKSINEFNKKYINYTSDALKTNKRGHEVEQEITISHNEEKMLDVPRTTDIVNNEVQCWLDPKGDIYSINGTDYLTRYPLLENTQYKEGIRIKGKQIEEMILRHPDIKVYAYHLTRSEDLSWFDESEGIKSFDYVEYVKKNLPESVRFEKVVFKNFEDYMELAYKTDHHWNHKGSHSGYTQIHNMISQDFKLSNIKEPINELEFDNLQWFGSRAKESGVNVAPDIFKAYEYDLGKYETYVGNRLQDFGRLQQYKDGNIDRRKNVNQYTNFFGKNEQNNIVKHVFKGNKYNLLIVCDSNNKPLSRVLASHFNTTVVLDYRVIRNVDVDHIITNNNIDIVLFVAQTKYWADTNTYLNNDQRYLFNGYPIIKE